MLCALGAALLCGVRCDSAPPSALGPPPASRPAVTAPESPQLAASEVAGTAVSSPHSKLGFRSARLLDEHFLKHGREFGATSPEQYLQLAQALRDAPVGGSVLEIVRGDGAVSRFDKASGAFIAFEANGTIRTFFRPNDGERYFYRQAQRRR